MLEFKTSYGTTQNGPYINQPPSIYYMTTYTIYYDSILLYIYHILLVIVNIFESAVVKIQRAVHKGESSVRLSKEEKEAVTIF